jgi:phytoene synthase
MTGRRAVAQPTDRLLSYSALEVKNHQPDRYFATLFAPAAAREALFALYAFDHEIGKVRHVVSQPMAGLIRLQWWRDALDAIASGRPPAHPVAQALQPMLGSAAEVRARLEAAIGARERELEDQPPADLEALERALEGSAAAIVEAALLILGTGDPATLEVGRKVGLVIGLAERLRDLERDRRQGRLLLPEAGEDENLEPLVKALAGRGLEHLRAARAKRRAVPATALAALLPATLAGQDLRRLRRSASTRVPRRRSAAAPLRLLWHHARGRF